MLEIGLTEGDDDDASMLISEDEKDDIFMAPAEKPKLPESTNRGEGGVNSPAPSIHARHVQILIRRSMHTPSSLSMPPEDTAARQRKPASFQSCKTSPTGSSLHWMKRAYKAATLSPRTLILHSYCLPGSAVSAIR